LSPAPPSLQLRPRLASREGDCGQSCPSTGSMSPCREEAARSVSPAQERMPRINLAPTSPPVVLRPPVVVEDVNAPRPAKAAEPLEASPVCLAPSAPAAAASRTLEADGGVLGQVTVEALCAENQRLREEVERQRMQLELLVGQQALSLGGAAPTEVDGPNAASAAKALGVPPSPTLSPQRGGGPLERLPTDVAARMEAIGWDSPRAKAIPRIRAPPSEDPPDTTVGAARVVFPTSTVGAARVATMRAADGRPMASGVHTPRVASGVHTPRAFSPRPSTALRSGVQSVPLPGHTLGYSTPLTALPARFVAQGDSALVPTAGGYPGITVRPPTKLVSKVVGAPVTRPCDTPDSPRGRPHIVAMEPAAGVLTPRCPGRFLDRPLSPTNWSPYRAKATLGDIGGYGGGAAQALAACYLNARAPDAPVTTVATKASARFQAATVAFNPAGSVPAPMSTPASSANVPPAGAAVRLGGRHSQPTAGVRATTGNIAAIHRTLSPRAPAQVVRRRSAECERFVSAPTRVIARDSWDA